MFDIDNFLPKNYTMTDETKKITVSFPPKKGEKILKVERTKTVKRGSSKAGD